VCSTLSLSLARALSLSPCMRLHFLTLSPSLTHYTCEHTHTYTLSIPEQSWHLRSLSICVSFAGNFLPDRGTLGKKLYFKKKLLLEIHCFFLSFTILLGRAQAVEQNASKRWVRTLKLKVSDSSSTILLEWSTLLLLIFINIKFIVRGVSQVIQIKSAVNSL